MENVLAFKQPSNYLLIEQTPDGKALFEKTAWKTYLKNLEENFLKEVNSIDEAKEYIDGYLLMFDVKPLSIDEFKHYKEDLRIPLNEKPLFSEFVGNMIRFES